MAEQNIFQKFWFFIKRIKLRVWLLLAFSFYVVGIIGGTIEEKKVNPDATYLSEVEDSIIVLMGEYPEKPRTLPAQIFRIFLLGVGIFAFGAIVAKVSSKLVTKALCVGEKMNDFDNDEFVIICNWNDKGANVVNQVYKAFEGENGYSDNWGIIILHTETVDLKSVRSKVLQESIRSASSEWFLKARERIIAVVADPTQYEVLKEYRVKEAKSVILLADDKTEKPDDKNALIALAITHHEGELKSDIHVIAELRDISREKHLKNAGVDEFVQVNNIASGILAQCAFYKDMSNIFNRLLSYSKDTNEIYYLFNQNKIGGGEQEKKILDNLAEAGTFSKIGEYFSEYRKHKKQRDNSIILLGFKKNFVKNQEDVKEDIFINPNDDLLFTDKDSLIVMAYDKSDLDKFVDWLKKNMNYYNNHKFNI